VTAEHPFKRHMLTTDKQVRRDSRCPCGWIVGPHQATLDAKSFDLIK